MKRYQPDELAVLFKRLFATQDGQDALKVLEARFENPSLITSAGDGTAMTNLTFARIGEQNVVKYIKSLINKEFENERHADGNTDE